MSPIFVTLLALALASPLFWIVRPSRFRHIGWIAAIVPATVAGWLIMQLPTLATGSTLDAQFLWSPRLGLEVALRIDGLAAFFGLIITVIGAAIALYAGYYFEDEPRLGYFYALLFLFMASMLGLVWADNLLLLYVFWEGTSMSSYLLIAFNDTNEEARHGARRAFLVTALGGLAMLMGMVILGNAARTYTISELVAMPDLSGEPFATVALALILLGAFTKSAQFPFHFWLPGAMSAPTPASAYLHSATMVKAGIYLLARLHPAFNAHPLWFWALLTVGGITMIIGALFALGKTDIKALLAYATISQLGVFVMLLAFDDDAALIAVIVGVTAHALYKGALFMVAGIIDHATGTRELRRLANLRVQLPLVTLVAFFAALSMAGVPPMFGFLAKELLLEKFVHLRESAVMLGWVGIAVTMVVAVLTVAAAFIVLWEAFLRRHPDVGEAVDVHHAPPVAFVLPPLLLTGLALVFPFVLPQVEGLIFAPPVNTIATTEVEVHLALWHGFNFTLFLSAIALLAGVVVFYLRAPIRQRFAVGPHTHDGAFRWEATIASLYQLATRGTRLVQGITLLQQARGILIAAVVVMAVALAAAEFPVDFPINWAVEPHVPEVIMGALAIFASIITVIARTRLGAITSLGVVGIAITLFYVFHGAPDLALTQLLIDILTVVLLVLIFYRIPPKPEMQTPLSTRIRNVVLSVFVGVTGFFFVLFSVSQPYFPVIGDYFLYNSVPLGHGANAVNVILMDFRAFDTLGEATVLGIAAIAGYAVLRAGLFRFGPHAPSADQETPAPDPAPREDVAKDS